MKFTLTIADDIATAILAHHGQAEAADPTEAMRGLVAYTLEVEAKNAVRAAATKAAAEQIDAGLDAALAGKFTVTKEDPE